MASNPPSTCCTIGVRHEGAPSGKLIKFENIEGYVAEATGKTIHTDTAILFLPDVIGIWNNSKLMADQYAANGYYTLMPDLFYGDQLSLNRPADFDIMAWVTKGTGGNNPHTWEAVDPIVEKSIKYLQDQGYKKIGAVGYCFGAKYVVRYLPTGKGINVGFVAHPSFVEEDELAAIRGPLSIAAAEVDHIFPKEKRHRSEEILIETKQPYQVALFGGVAHGFAVRCDLSKKHEKFAKEQAFLQAVAWFDEHLL
ncbi:alpha/beta-hydrolase [Diplocarpon rosae]|nr:alpha/beta-hydrolase [Diplocarpon rosae]